jgi:thioesterase domain-containing protein
VVDRHEALRATFDTHAGEPTQWIHRDQPPAWTLIDLSMHTGSDQEQEAYIFARREVYKPFDLRTGPLVRLVFIRLHSHRHIILGILHHIICDGRSLELFAGELATCYAVLSSGAEPELEPLPLQYADYACWQREWLSSNDFDSQLSYWTKKLAGARFLLDLSANGVRPAERSFDGSSQARRLPEDLVRQLKAIARRYDATPFGLSLAIFYIALHHYTDQSDILVGMPVAARSRVELEQVVGLLANLVVVRVDLSGDPLFSALLRQVRDAVLGALTNQDVPFERVVEALHPARNLAQNPIFQVLFASVKAIPWKRFGGLEASPYTVEALAVPFDLTVSIIDEESSDTCWLRADYRTDLFTYDQMNRLLDHYVHLLWSVSARPEVRLSQLDRPSDWTVANGARKLKAASGTNTPPGDFDLARSPARSDAPQFGRDERGASAAFVEEVLASLWAKALGTRPSSTTSNFFDVGGHSLMAMYLASAIGRVYGINFPVSLIFQEPTIEGMARRLQGAVCAASSVVSIQDDGSRPPFFCGGSMPELVDLSRALGSEQPFFQLDIFALQQQRFFANRLLFSSVPDLAARFRHDIVSIQPIGPYYLGGMCEGGILALEIALQLQAQGHEVALLAQFDTPVNGYWHKRPVDWVLHAWSLVYSCRLGPRMRDHLRARLTRRVTRSPEEETYAHIVKVTWEAIRAYRPDRVFEGEIHLFRSPRSPPWPYEDAAAGWHARASQGIRVHDVVSEHVKIFCEPLSQRIIASVIERAQRDLVAK